MPGVRFIECRTSHQLSVLPVERERYVREIEGRLVWLMWHLCRRCGEHVLRPIKAG